MSSPCQELLVFVLALSLAGCAEAPARPEPMAIGEARKFELIELKAPTDLVEVVREEIARELTKGGFQFLQMTNALPDLQLRVAVDGWDYFESRQAVPFRERTASMNLTFDVIDPATGRVLHHRTYVGVDSARDDVARTVPTETGLANVRRAAAQAAAKFVDDLLPPGKAASDAPR